MKILKIRFENIHSLKGEHVVDFGNGILAEAGLFAITGSTGSGKSTLLDVITLALYNRIARVDKAVSNSILEDDGGIMTRNMKSCFAEVEYRVNGKDYRSHWSIERNRNNNLNARKQELVAVATDQILESGTKTPDKNQEIIGLSYEQFVKAMVLSQGEFSKLLQAPRNERNKLLEDITGARSYREIGRAIFFKYSGINKKIELKNAGLEGIEILTSVVIAEKQTALKTLIESKPKIEKSYNLASENIKTRQELQKKQAEQKELEIEKQKLKEALETFKPFKIELEKHEKLSKYGVSLREYDSAIKELNQLKDDLHKLSKSNSEAEKTQKSYLDAVSTLLKEKVASESVNQKLDEFRAKIVTMQAEEKKKQSDASLYQEQLNRNVANINQLGYNLPKAAKPEAFALQVENLRNTVQETIKISGVNSIEELNSQLALARQASEKAADLLIKKEQLLKIERNLNAQIDELKAANQSFEADVKTIKDLNTDVSELKNEVEILEKNLEQQRKHQSLDEHRHQLAPEKPCPLCGSIHHPYATAVPHFDIKEDLLKAKKDSYQTKGNFLITLKEKNKFQLEKINGFTKNIEILKGEEAHYLDVIIKLAHQLNWNYKEDLETLVKRRADLNQSIQKMERSKQGFQAATILKDLEDNLKQWELTLTAYTSLKQERTALYNGQDINEKTNILSSRLTSAIASLASIKKQLKDTDEKLKVSASAKLKKEVALNTIIAKEEIENLEALRKAILPEERASRIRKQESELRVQNTRISEKENTLLKSLKELSAKDASTVSLETLKILFEESKKKWDALSMDIGKITQSLEDDENNKKRQQKVIDELNLLKKDLALWKTMNDLIGDATGNKFSNFVQDLTLEQLIGFANKRLSEFSDRYLLDIPTAAEAEKSDTLKIFDNYMGNARRSVRTLSGGETFLVSLAMAFALSDIAARNVKIESLFIDEGFGTLDPETLEQAITILEKMQNEGDKSVGVISHVSALKERITTQVKLEKGSLGYSTLEVVG